MNPYAARPRPGSVEEFDMMMQAQQAQKPKSQGIDPRAWISEIGGTIGTIGGGIIGGPGGAAAGAAAGTALGKALEQKVKGEAINPQDLLTESALSALFAYGPLRAAGKLTGISATKGLQALGAKPASQLAQKAVSSATQTAATTAAEGVFKPSKAQLNIAKQVFNLKAGAKVGQKTLTDAQSTKLVQFLFDENLIKPNSTVQSVYNALSKYQAKTGTQIGKIIAGADVRPVTFATAKQTLKRSIDKSFKDVLVQDPTSSVFAQNVRTRVMQAKTPAELWDALQLVRSPRALVGGADATSSSIRQFANRSYTEISKALKDIIPGYNQLAGKYTIARNLDDFVSAAARTSKVGGTTFGRLPIFPSMVERAATTAATIGAPGAKAGKQGIVQGAYNLLNPPARQGIGRAGVQALGPRGTLQMANQALPGASRRMIGAGLAGLSAESAQQMPTDMGGMVQPQMGMTQQTVQSPYPYENLMYDMQRDPQNATKYLDYYNQISQLYAGPKLNATQQQRATAAQNALNDIPLLVDAIQSGKFGIQQAIPGAQTGIGQRVLGTGNLQAAMFNVVDNILRARTGAAMPESEVRRYMLYLMPTPYESQTVQLEKLARLTRELQGYANPSGSAGTTLEDLLMQQSGGR